MSLSTGTTTSAAAPAPTPVTDAVQGNAPATPTMYKVKVNGEEQEVDINELTRGYAHNKAASETFRQAQETRQLAESVLELFKTDPKQAFAKLGKDAKKFAEEVLMEEINEAHLTPEQKKMRDLERYKSDMETKEQRAREEQERQQMEIFQQQVAQELQQDIVSVLQTADLPKNEYTVGRIAYYLEAAMTAGYDASAKDVVGLVKNEYETEIKRLLSSVPEDKLLTWIGDDMTKKVVKGHIARTGAKQKQAPRQNTGVKLDQTAKAPERPATLRDFFKNKNR